MNILADVGYIQAERILRIESPLGFDVLLPERMEVREEISGLFEIAVALRSKRTDIAADEIVGRLVDVSLESGDGARRPWNGLVTEMLEGPAVSRGLRSYRLTIRPKLWLLSQRSDCRIWQDKTSLEVMETLLSEHGVGAAVTRGVLAPPAAETYSVQYNESDLAYLTRRLETDGLFYWFEHEPGKHTLHVATHGAGYTEGPQTDVRLAAGSTDRNHVNRFEKRYLFTPGRRAGADWNFETPRFVPLADTPSLAKLTTNRDYELYEYPAKALDMGASEAASRLRMQAVEADHERIDGGSTVRTLSPARRFRPYDVAHPDQTYEEHVVTAIVHQAVDRSYETNEGQPDYVNSFTALPSRLPATPHRATPRPRIDGAQVAVVAGPPGEEIHPDQYGRIKLWFPWDRRRKKDGTDTCWVRVMQSWAGGAWGAQVIPRIGMEVMVSYLEGDPDRPVVTGVVPNPENKVPYELPANKTRSVFKTKTHKGFGWNELRFEDATFMEEIHVHAQKDMNEKVRHNKTRLVGNSEYELIGNDKILNVLSNYDQMISGSLRIHVGDSKATHFASLDWYLAESLAPISARLPETLFNAGEDKDGSYSLDVSGAISMTALAAVSIEGLGTVSLASAQDATISAVRNVNISADSVLAQRADAVTVRGRDRLVLECGEARIVMTSDGKIKIIGTRVEIN